jgi:hypothetical protein
VSIGDPDVDPVATAVSVFGAVHKAIGMFEEPDALGRPVDWAFDAPQLLVVPRAGQTANAYYECESHSLQFFYFTDPTGADRWIYTSDSQDVVAHETAHGLLDGSLPDLYSDLATVTRDPRGGRVSRLAARLVALPEAGESRAGGHGGRIDNSNAFSGLAEQFARALDPERHNLRNLNNTTRVQESQPRAARAVDRAVRRLLRPAAHDVRRAPGGTSVALAK